MGELNNPTWGTPVNVPGPPGEKGEKGEKGTTGSAGASAVIGSSGASAEVEINKEIEPSATEGTIVTLVGEVEKAKTPAVVVEVDGAKAINGVVLTAAAGANTLISVGSFAVKAKGKYKVPTVSGLLKVFASYAAAT